jgi:hypothetical protein
MRTPARDRAAMTEETSRNSWDHRLLGLIGLFRTGQNQKRILIECALIV